jgi:2-keto-4-pentenoate hydratase/2-oxohepta-3-ene-1,7-dioic acid hydratase in catechol pathway
MKLLTFREQEALQLGVMSAGGVVDVAAAASALGAGPSVPATMDALIAGGARARAAVADVLRRADGRDGDWLKDPAAVALGPSVPHPGKILCVGLNYREHARESGAAIPRWPVLFSKFANAIAGPGDEVPLIPAGIEYDYEVELGVVIGRPARNVTEDDALSFVLGYTTANDLSCRDLQMRSGQWLLGKTLDRFLPVGPYLVTADEAGDPQDHDLRTWHNGVLRQDSNTGDQIFAVAQVIAYASQFFTLEPGDLIVTGTPAGVILGLPVKRWLQSCDEVVVEVEGLGTLTNRMVAG